MKKENVYLHHTKARAKERGSPDSAKWPSVIVETPLTLYPGPGAFSTGLTISF